jgi:hypothetical protein
MLSLRRAFLALFGALFFAGHAHAGAWLQKAGKGERIHQFTHYSSANFFDAEGEKQPQPRFRKWEYQPYVEYGLLPQLTIGATTFAHKLSQSGENNYGFADTELFVRTRLWQGEGEIVSLQPLIKLPSAYRRQGTPRGGNATLDAELSVLYGQNLNLLSPRDYSDLRIGYRVRGGSLYDQIRTDTTLALSPADDITLLFSSRSIVAARSDDTVTFREDGAQDFSLFKLEAAVQYDWDARHRISLGASHHFAGAQTGNGTGIQLSFSERF